MKEQKFTDRYGRTIRVKMCGGVMCRWIPPHTHITRRGVRKVKGVWRRLVAT